MKNREIDPKEYEVIDVSLEHQKINPEMFWSIDVIEHMKNPSEIFKWISDETKVVAYFTDTDDKAGGRHPFHFKIDETFFDNEFNKRDFVKKDHSFLNVWIRSNIIT